MDLRSAWVGNIMLKENQSTCTNNGTFLDTGKPGHVCILACLVLLIVLTIAFNLSVLIKINSDKRHKKNTRFLLSSLACVDTCVGIIIMPLQTAILYYDVPVAASFGLRFCDVLNSLDVTFSSISIFHLTLLTWERYVAICNPFEYAFICSKKRLALAYVLGWVTVLTCSFGTIMPGYQLIGAEVHECQEVQPKCQLIGGLYVVVSFSMVTLVFPIVFIVCFNLKVLYYVRKTRSEQNALREPGERINKIRHARVTVTIAILNGCFLFCWLPFTVVNVTDAVKGLMVPVIVSTISLWLGYANSAMNPFLVLLLEGKNCIRRK
ncbi:histamine H2 receptor-like [Dreissena polymorpha]|nr:histamine H2 receptor-like [Dreissena polymorpha]